MLKEKAFGLLAFLDPAVKWCIMVLFQFSHVFISYINKGDIDQESLGVLALSENTMIGSKIRHQTSNSRSQRAPKARATVCSFAQRVRFPHLLRFSLSQDKWL